MTTDTLTFPSTAEATTAAAVVIPRGAPRWLLRLEGAIELAAALAAYSYQGGAWGAFAALFLVPDLSLLGYLAGPRIGAGVYNAGHSHVAPAVLAAVAVLSGNPALLLGSTIWIAHIGFDRMLGYGLKYTSGFRDTHLGHVGRAPRA
jgi:Domain of unknown function (DUF4260)